MSGLAAPAFTAMPTFEIISKALLLPISLGRPPMISVLVMTTSTPPFLMSARIAGWPLKLTAILFSGILPSNIGSNVPITSGSGPPLDTTVMLAALAVAVASTQAAVSVAIFDQAFIASSLWFARCEPSSCCYETSSGSAGLQSLGFEYGARSGCRQKRNQRVPFVRQLGVSRNAGRELRGVLQFGRQRAD